MGQVLSPIELNILIRKRRVCNPPYPKDMAANAAKKDKSAEVRALKAASYGSTTTAAQKQHHMRLRLPPHKEKKSARPSTDIRAG